MSSNLPSARCYSFGPFSLEPAERRLTKQGTPIPLTPKAFDLLVILVENAGRLMEKDILMKCVWQDAFVEEANLANNISALRKALGATITGTEYIETVPRRGYRFAARLEVLSEGNVEERSTSSYASCDSRESDFAVAAPPAGRYRVSIQGWLFAMTITILAVGVVVAITRRQAERVQAASHLIRFTVALPPGTQLPPNGEPIAPALSPDGTRLAFRVLRRGEPVLAVRGIDTLETRILDGTEGARFSFWSPDNRVIAFFADGKLKRINASGGPVQIICETGPGFGGTWNRENLIVFSPSATDGLLQVPASGGQPTQVTTLQKGEMFHQHPQFLPDGRRFLYFAAPDSVYLGSLDRDSPIRVLTSVRRVQYSSGYLLYLQNRTLFAQAFDIDHARLSGDPVPLGENIRTGGTNVQGRAVGGASFSVSDNGVLAYGAEVPVHSTLAWLDRVGRPVSAVKSPPFDRFSFPELSPDGRLVAVGNSTRSFAEEIWLLDTVSGRSTQLTFNSLADLHSVWSPDSGYLAFASNKSNPPGIYQKKVTGEKSEELLVESDSSRVPWPSDWTSRGLLYEVEGSGIWLLLMNGDRTPHLLLRDPQIEPDAKFSPDSNWFAYTSGQSGRPEVFVQSVSTPAAKRRVSTAGGSLPRWGRDQKELFYLGADGRLMVVPLEANSGTLTPGTPKELFQTSLSQLPRALRAYGVSPEGERFLLPLPTPENSGSPTSLVVVSNWPAAMKQ